MSSLFGSLRELPYPTPLEHCALMFKLHVCVIFMHRMCNNFYQGCGMNILFPVDYDALYFNYHIQNERL